MKCSRELLSRVVVADRALDVKMADHYANFAARLSTLSLTPRAFSLDVEVGHLYMQTSNHTRPKMSGFPRVRFALAFSLCSGEDPFALHTAADYLDGLANGTAPRGGLLNIGTSLDLSDTTIDQ